MKLKKIQLNEGIRLSEVGDHEWIYSRIEDTNYSVWYKHISNKQYLNYTLKRDLIEEYSKRECCNNNHCIIRDNQIIDIIQNEEYDNNKPYLIGKNKKNIISCLYMHDNEFYISIFVEGELDINPRCKSLNDVVALLQSNGYNVYKQK